jgi:hypothetical protein
VEYKFSVRCINDELSDSGISVPEGGEHVVELVRYLQDLAQGLDHTIGEAKTAAIFSRAADVMKHDAVCRYGPDARARKRQPIANDAVLPRLVRVPNSVALVCPHCGIDLYVDRSSLEMNTHNLPVSCLGCRGRSEYVDGNLQVTNA